MATQTRDAHRQHTQRHAPAARTQRRTTMPMITVDMREGRTVEQKRALVQRLTEAFVETCDCPPDGVWIVLRDVSTDNWAIGGRLQSDGPVEA
ncbi:4-oxalocrotonate tautomerase family protein [Kitasatospora sp. NPDC101157]|uniref:tautomerase family protein n=1 Tax=Kitasatospora sp. NPDC101157 TaxID=3364098 RepID=UPI00380F76E9